MVCSHIKQSRGTDKILKFDIGKKQNSVNTIEYALKQEDHEKNCKH
jgi:hypothetical protein